MNTKSRKYSIPGLLEAFRKAAAFRNAMVKAGFSDNLCAIQSASRVLDILCCRLRYPDLGHSNNLKDCPGAEFSDEAWKSYMMGKPVYIEHVAPHRAFTQEAIRRIDEGASDEQVLKYLKKNYRLVLLTKKERQELDRKNRTKIDPKRVSHLRIRPRKRKE